MRFSSALVFAILLLATTGASTASSSQGALDVENHWVLFEPGMGTLDIDFSTLGQSIANAISISLEKQPVHGTVEVLRGRFRYSPSIGFYGLRSDSFSFRLTKLNGDYGVATVFVSLRTDDVEIEPLELRTDLDSTVRARQVGTLRGDPAESGRIKVQGCDFDNLQEAVAIITVGPDPDSGAVGSNARVVLNEIVGDTQHVEIRAEVRDSRGFWVSSLGATIDHQIQNLDFDWWPSTPNAADGGAILRVDGQALLVAGVDTANLDLSWPQVGIVPLDGSLDNELGIGFDQVVVFAQGQTDRASLMALVGFEQKIEGLWGYHHGNSTEIVTSTALTGRHVMESSLAFGNGFSVMELEPSGGDQVAAEEELAVRLTIDVSDLQMVPGDLFRFFDLGSVSNSNFGVPHTNLRLTSFQGILHLALYSGSPIRNTAWVPVSGKHQVDLQWTTSTGSDDRASGFAALWVDGQLIEVMRHLDIEGEVVNWLRLGAMGVDANTGGELRLDDLMVWR